MCRLSLVILGWTLFAYILTLTFVTYVGVYLTYIAVPTIIITGIISYFCEEREEEEEEKIIFQNELDKLNKENKELNFSYYSEFTYSYKKHLAISFGLEKLTESYSIFGHIELPDLWIFKGMISYYQQGISSLDDMFNTTSISSVLRSAIRIEILPVLFINAYAGKEWSFWPPEKLRKNDSLQGHYISSWDANVELEIGYEWE